MAPRRPPARMPAPRRPFQASAKEQRQSLAQQAGLYQVDQGGERGGRDQAGQCADWLVGESVQEQGTLLFCSVRLARVVATYAWE